MLLPVHSLSNNILNKFCQIYTQISSSALFHCEISLQTNHHHHSINSSTSSTSSNIISSKLYRIHRCLSNTHIHRISLHPTSPPFTHILTLSTHPHTNMVVSDGIMGGRGRHIFAPHLARRPLVVLHHHHHHHGWRPPATAAPAAAAVAAATCTPI